jgi:hypothetical protein
VDGLALVVAPEHEAREAAVILLSSQPNDEQDYCVHP